MNKISYDEFVARVEKNYTGDKWGIDQSCKTVECIECPFQGKRMCDTPYRYALKLSTKAKLDELFNK
jgi:hypothetical protein